MVRVLPSDYAYKLSYSCVRAGCVCARGIILSCLTQHIIRQHVLSGTVFYQPSLDPIGDL
jgi:hypothetical protein